MLHITSMNIGNECTLCHGSGMKTNTQPCSKCGGSGRIGDEEDPILSKEKQREKSKHHILQRKQKMEDDYKEDNI